MQQFQAETAERHAKFADEHEEDKAAKKKIKLAKTKTNKD